MNAAPHRISLDWRGRSIAIEHQWITGAPATAPLIVFLHEGLGSLAMWRDFPAQLCAAAGARGLVWSRPGYGGSTPREADERWAPDFMHRQAHEVLPALLDALGIDAQSDRVWLFGHSDGATIALLYAARDAARSPSALAGVIAVAPHILVEDVTLASIEKARIAYETTDLKQRLARYHAEPDSAFWGWNRIWLDPAFRAWTIVDELSPITCPLLAVQGLDDEYGSIEQIRGIQRRVAQAELLEIPGCGHSPHKDNPTALIQAAVSFMTTHSPGD